VKAAKSSSTATCRIANFGLRPNPVDFTSRTMPACGDTRTGEALAAVLTRLLQAQSGAEIAFVLPGLN